LPAETQTSEPVVEDPWKVGIFFSFKIVALTLRKYAPQN
jgi:hypothetical protein